MTNFASGIKADLYRLCEILTCSACCLLLATSNASFAGVIAEAPDGASGVAFRGTNGVFQGFTVLPSGAISSLDYDPINGDLYIAATSGLWLRTPAGVLTQVNNSSYALNSSFDITVFSQVPEPSSLALAGLAAVGLALTSLGRRRLRRRSLDA